MILHGYSFHMDHPHVQAHAGSFYIALIYVLMIKLWYFELIYRYSSYYRKILSKDLILSKIFVKIP